MSLVAPVAMRFKEGPRDVTLNAAIMLDLEFLDAEGAIFQHCSHLEPSFSLSGNSFIQQSARYCVVFFRTLQGRIMFSRQVFVYSQLVVLLCSLAAAIQK